MKRPVNEVKLLPAGTRRVYVAPSLNCYGLVQDLTQAGTGSMSEAAASASTPSTCGLTNYMSNPNCPSDSRLKTNIRSISTSLSGMQFYLFEYKPEYKPECGHGTYFGYMAQEVLQKYPSAVVTRSDGYLAIDYRLLNQLLH